MSDRGAGHIDAEEAERRPLKAQVAAMAGVGRSSPQTWWSEGSTMLRCPRCGSALVVVGGNEIACKSCGEACNIDDENGPGQ